MKHVATYIKVFLLILVASACMKDKGNYNYTSVNEITIRGLDSLYIVDFGTRFRLTPELIFSKDKQEDTNYTYQWVNDHQIGFTGAPKVFSNSRNIDTLLKMAYGSYFMYYRVTDKRTGIFKDAYFTMIVTAPSYEGWMLLCELKNGSSRLDMVSRRGGTDTLYRNILATVGSAFPMTGKPSFIATANSAIPPGNGSMSIFIATSEKGAILGRDTMNYLPSYDINNSLVSGVPVKSYAGATIDPVTYGGLMCADNDLYAFDFRNILGPVNIQDNVPVKFKASTMMAVGGGTSIVFNEDTKTFLRYPQLGPSCLTLPAGTLFNFSTGKDLLYLKYSTFNGGEAFAVLRDPANGKRYLARMTVAGLQRYYAEMTATDFANATQFAVSPVQGYVFYAAGSKIYEFDFATGKSILMKDYGNRKISLMQFRQFATLAATQINGAFYTELSKKLLVCTYLDSDPDATGTLDIYNVPDINAQITLYKSYPGTGKVVSLTYRER